MIFLAFTVILMAIFDFAQFLFIHQTLAERARYAARWGAVTNPANTSGIQNMVMYQQSTAPTGATPYMNLTSSMVQVSTAGSGSDDYRLSVAVVNYPYSVFSPLMAGTYYGPNITVSVPLGNNF